MMSKLLGSMETKDIVVLALAAIGSVTGIGNTVNEYGYEADANFAPDIEANSSEIEANSSGIEINHDDIEQLRRDVVSLKIQNCLAINEIKRMQEIAVLSSCAPN